MDNENILSAAIHALKELEEDSTVPRNVKLKIKSIIDSLTENKEIPIKVSRALQDLDEIADDSNIQTYTRTQIWNVVSMLEKV